MNTDSTSPQTIEELFMQHYLPMVKLASWLLNDQDLAEETVQDVFVRFAAPTFELAAVTSPVGYLRTAVVNQSRSRLRRLRAARKFVPERPEHVDAHENFLADETLAAAVAKLPRRQRECIVLRFTEDLRVTEIAQVLNISHGTVSKHIQKGLKHLETVLGEHPDHNAAGLLGTDEKEVLS